MLAPVGTGVGEVAWFLLREAHARLRPAGAVAAGVKPVVSGPGGVVPDGSMPDERASVMESSGLLASGARAPKAPPPSCPLPEAERPRALVVLDDAAGWPDPRGRVGMLLTGAAGLGLQVWAGADGDEALIDALGVGMAAVLTDAGTVVDLRGVDLPGVGGVEGRRRVGRRQAGGHPDGATPDQAGILRGRDRRGRHRVVAGPFSFKGSGWGACRRAGLGRVSSG